MSRHLMYKKHIEKRRIKVGVLATLYILVAVVFTSHQFLNSFGQTGSQVYEEHYVGRKLLQVANGSSSANETEKCTEPSVKEFPSDLFTQQQRRYGAVILHILMAIYMFAALAFVCDDYFISALDKICQRLDLSEDVAGATFMAAGSSAPEFFTSIIGVFITKGDVGVGTIVGSAVFNILVIIALCATFAGQVVHLTWWPLIRDSSVYILSIALLILVMHDGSVTWWESLIMVCMYIGYIILMKCNPRIVDKINSRKKRAQPDVSFTNNGDKSSCLVDNEEVEFSPDDERGQRMNDLLPAGSRRRLTWKELGMMIMMTDKFSPTTRFRAACLVVILRGEHKSATPEEKEKILRKNEANDNYQTVNNGDIEGRGGDDEREESIEGTPFLYPQGSIVRIIFWILSLPLVIILYFTIPDCRKPKWEAWYILTFILSIFWICIFSYVMVWMVSLIGFTFGIPDVIMGLVFLAAGTSIPDAISSLLVAKEGLGDMAVSNSIGSNVFDILIGLAVPWFIRTAMVNPGSTVHLNSRGMVFSVALLFASVLFTVLVIHLNKWKLDKKLGIIFFLVYLVFITFSSLIEFNVFGFVNYPVCAFHG
ncbi:sodium/potassium/calcium exchanger 4-like isoform X2 [Clytia hemisphaerica]|uniref:Sodium/calcium exchanger membrane region domain-containing protein n=1 Tax=Clytia hemisphaerica TaxID=252671 RepID=A0A7M5UZT2_9CNID